MLIEFLAVLIGDSLLTIVPMSEIILLPRKGKSKM